MKHLMNIQLVFGKLSGDHETELSIFMFYFLSLLSVTVFLCDILTQLVVRFRQSGSFLNFYTLQSLVPSP